MHTNLYLLHPTPLTQIFNSSGAFTTSYLHFSASYFTPLKLRCKISSASRRACSELNVAYWIILYEFSTNRIDVLPYFSSSMGLRIEGVCKVVSVRRFLQYSSLRNPCRVFFQRRTNRACHC